MKNTLEAWSNIGKSFLNLIYPLECQICKASLGPFKEGGLCHGCRSKIKLNLPPFCLRCGRSLMDAGHALKYCRDCSRTTYHFQRSWAVGSYDGILKECIHLFKFKGRLALVPTFTELLLNFTRLYIKVAEFDAIVPVPLHRTKSRERNFNQAEVLARDFSLKTGISLNARNLIKIRHTLPQSELSKEKRILNIKGAFKVVDPSLFKNKNILLMDDVFTTGCTLNECAKMILESRASRVECLVLARG